MNRPPTHPHEFDHRLQQLQRQADASLSPVTLARLRNARRPRAATVPPWQRRGWWLATACSAVLAVTVLLQLDHGRAPATAPVAASDNEDPLLFDESPELFLWLGSDTLAME